MIKISSGNRSEVVGNYSNTSYKLTRAWEAFVAEGVKPKPKSILRAEIISSWERSSNLGVDPFQQQVNNNVSMHDLIDFKEKNEKLLHYANEDMKYLAKSIEGSETIITISDNNGLLLDSYGDISVHRQAEKINFLPGAVWNEQSAGTNAIGTVIENKKPFHIMFKEHFSIGWQDWFCAGAPIINPFTDELMGVLDLSGKWKNTNPHTLGLVITKANSITKSIERLLYYDGLKVNPFLKTALGSVEDGVMITDLKKNILKVNTSLTSILGVEESRVMEKYPLIKEMVETILNEQGSMVEGEIVVSRNKKKYTCTVYPVSIDQHTIIGTFIRLKESVPIIKRQQVTSDHPSPSYNKAHYSFSHMIGSSPKFIKAVKAAKKAAKFNATLLLNGETGTGKEMFVQAIHHASNRRDGPFIAINCGAIAPNLIVSELFGYEEGAFTGAKKKGSQGKFELANGGTIFLDEIGDMPLEAQVHLLRVLEEKEVTRIGGSQPIPVDVRVIAATHRNLQKAVNEGKFREDLLFRLRVIQLTLPSLRERKEDIPDLFRYYIHHLSADFGKEALKITPEAVDILQAYSWPGNIRELKNVVEQVLFHMDGNVIEPDDLPKEVKKEQIKEEQSEKEQLLAAIQLTGGNITQAAKHLGISRATIYRKMKRMNISEHSRK